MQRIIYNKLWRRVMDDKTPDEILSRFNIEKYQPGRFYDYLSYAFDKHLNLAKVMLEEEGRFIYAHTVKNFLLSLIFKGNLEGLHLFIQVLQQRKNPHLKQVMEEINHELVLASHAALRNAWDTYAFILKYYYNKLPFSKLEYGAPITYIDLGPKKYAVLQYLWGAALEQSDEDAFYRTFNFYLINKDFDAAFAVLQFALSHMTGFFFPNVHFMYAGIDSQIHLEFAYFIAQRNQAIQLKDPELISLKMAYVAYYQPTISLTLARSDIFNIFLPTLLAKSLKNDPFEAAIIEKAKINLLSDRANDEKEYIDLVLRLFLADAHKNSPRAQYWFEVLMSLPGGNAHLVKYFNSLEERSTDMQYIYDYVTRDTCYKNRYVLADIINKKILVGAMIEEKKSSDEKAPILKKGLLLEDHKRLVAAPVPLSCFSASQNKEKKLQFLDEALEKSGLDKTMTQPIKENLIAAYEEDEKKGATGLPALRQAAEDILKMPVVQQAKTAKPSIYEKILNLCDRISAWIHSFNASPLERAMARSRAQMFQPPRTTTPITETRTAPTTDVSHQQLSNSF